MAKDKKVALKQLFTGVQQLEGKKTVIKLMSGDDKNALLRWNTFVNKATLKAAGIDPEKVKKVEVTLDITAE